MVIKFSSKPYMPVLIISGVMLFIAVFLPWATAGTSITGFYGSGVEDWGTMTTVAAILGILLAFLVSRQFRAVGIIAVGLLGLVGAVVYATRLNGATVGFGLILEIIASLIAVWVGYVDYRQTITPTVPPAPPAPPQP